MDSPKSGSMWEGGGVGSLSMPSLEVEVQLSTPPTILYYWVLKQNLDRLKNALEDERADRRLEFIFGFSGLAIGTAPGFWITISEALANNAISALNGILTVIFIVAIFLAFYFWIFVKRTKVAATKILDDITGEEYGTNVTGTPSESGRGSTGGRTRTVRQRESSGGG